MTEQEQAARASLKVLCTFPGKFGDLLWALPSIRAVSECLATPVDLVIAGRFASIVPLLQAQAYLGRVWADAAWAVQDTAPMTPRVPPILDGPTTTWRLAEYDRVLHLGYRGWPDHALPYETERCLWAQWPSGGPQLLPIDLVRPWITPPTWAAQLSTQDVAVGFTEEHFELKTGIVCLLTRVREPALLLVNLSTGPRWYGEYYTGGYGGDGLDWEAAAAYLTRSTIFLGDCSALHVLACAIGTPCVLMEPAEARHHEIFWPYGKVGPQVTQVIGGDGKWTWDARHVWETVQAVGTRRVLEGVPQ